MINYARYLRIAIFSVSCLAISLTESAWSAPKTVRDPLQVIETAFAEGHLNLDQRALLIAQAITNPQSLPEQYQTDAVRNGESLGRSATMALVGIKREWNQLSLATQQELDALLSRPSASYLYDSPSGFFKLHYDTEGGNAVPSTDADVSGVPDYIEKVATYCDTSLFKHRQLGYLDPPSDGSLGGDEKFDIYFVNAQYYGYTQPENDGPQAWNDVSSYIVLNRNFYNFPPNTDPEGNQAGAAKATAVHEFHHAVQFAYDYGDEGWMMELDATYMEDIVFDHTNDNYNYLPEYLQSPQKSLMKSTITGYSRFIYELFLANQFDTSLMVAAWEGGRYKTVFQTLNDTLWGRYGVSQDSAFALFTAWNYFTGGRDDGLHHEEASFYPAAAIARSHSTYPIEETFSPQSVEGYAASYIKLNLNGHTGNMGLTFNGYGPRQWAAYLIKIPNAGPSELVSFELDQSGDGELLITLLEDYSQFILVAVNLDEYSFEASFSYSAELITPFLIYTERLSDTSAFSGKLSYFQYLMINQNSVGEVIDILYEDDRDWTPAGAVSYFVYPGDSATAYIPVSPPAETPLGERSQLHVRTQLRVDSLARSDAYFEQVTIPKRGDVNYDSRVNLTDITTLIGFVYLKGAAPIPPQNGDWDCNGKHNLADITAVIAFVYLHGAKSPCDNYIE